MREDMFKVIVERPRSGRSWAGKTKLRYLDKDDGRQRVSGKRLAREFGNTKYLNENLAPLRRYLFKQRGRKWDDVFSDVCARLDTGSTVKMHVREHLDDFIVRHIGIDQDGMFYDMDSPTYRHRADSWWKNLYVCPYDGRLKETKNFLAERGMLSTRINERNKRRKQFRQRTYKNSFRRESEIQFLVLCDNIWYRFETTSPPIYSDGRPMCAGAIRNELRTFNTINHPQWALKSKQQLSSKELKKHGLKNGGDDV